MQSVSGEDLHSILIVPQRDCNPTLSCFALLQIQVEIIQAHSLLPPLPVNGFSTVFFFLWFLQPNRDKKATGACQDCPVPAVSGRVPSALHAPCKLRGGSADRALSSNTSCFIRPTSISLTKIFTFLEMYWFPPEQQSKCLKIQSCSQPGQHISPGVLPVPIFISLGRDLLQSKNLKVSKTSPWVIFMT